MDRMDDGEFPAEVREAARRRWRFGAGTARAILKRTRAGESLRSICRDPQMPATHTVARWLREKPGFAAAMDRARRAAGGPFRGGRSSYCEATAQAIFDRICAGEALIRICRDPDMPTAATVMAWRRRAPEFDEAVRAAYEIRAEVFFEQGWEMAQAVTPQTAFAAKVQLHHLRWHVGKLAPRIYGAIKAAEPPEAPKVTVVCLRHFWIEEGPDGRRRVRASKVDPDTRQIVEEEPGPWKDPLPGQVIEPRHPSLENGRGRTWTAPSDPEGWT